MVTDKMGSYDLMNSTGLCVCVFVYVTERELENVPNVG